MQKILVHWIMNSKEHVFCGLLPDLPKIGQNLILQKFEKPNIEVDFGRVLNVKQFEHIFLVRTTEGVYELVYGEVPEKPMADILPFRKSQKKAIKRRALTNLCEDTKKYRQLEKFRYNEEKRRYRKKVMKIVSERNI